MRPETHTTPLEGVCHLALEIHGDQRGSLTEVFRRDWFEPEGFGPLQSNLSQSRQGVLRGLHFHRRQTDYWICVKGSLRAVLLDLRQGSPSWKKSYAVELTQKKPEALLIPPGVAHGYYASSDMALIYLVDQLYDGSDECGVLWCDEELEPLWGVEGKPVVSERDATNPSLTELTRQGKLPVFER